MRPGCGELAASVNEEASDAGPASRARPLAPSPAGPLHTSRTWRQPRRPEGVSCHNTLVRDTALSLVVRTVVACGKPEMPGPGPDQRSPAAHARPGPRGSVPRPRIPGPAAPASSGNAHTRANLHDREGFTTP